LKISTLSLPAAALLTAAVFTAATVAQTPQTSPPAQAGSASPHSQHQHPAPTNLQVLPKTMTGEQVHELMEKWEGYLGVKCSTCHAADPKNIGPNGRPRLNYADDSKDEKQTARLMFKMTEDINVNYVSKVPSSDTPVTCGTCHRGHLGPEPFILPPDENDHDHDHDAPPPPAGTKPAPPK
jgi:hypothetical protein